MKNIKKFITLSYVCAGITIVSAVCAAFLHKTAAAVSAVVAAAAAVGAAILLKNIFYIMRKRMQYAEEISDKIAEYAGIRFDKSCETAFVSENFSEITGIDLPENFDGTLNTEEYKNLASELIACPSSAGADIYMAARKECWVRIRTFDTPEYEFTVITDVSELVSCKNIINSLKYYDSETGTLCRDAFISKVRSVSDSGVVGLVTVLISGIDMVSSFKGTAAANRLCAKTAAAVRRFENPHNVFVGRTSSYEFAVLLTDTYEEGCRKYAEKLLKSASEAVSETDGSEYARIYCGYAFFPNGGNDAGAMLSSAGYAAFEAKSSSASAPVPFNENSYTTSELDFKKIQVFNALIDGNMLAYHFQPIVDAHTGEIFGYEALMRPKEIDGVRLPPLEVVEISEKQGRSPELERLTLSNTIRFLSENQDSFRSRKLFVNSIPNCFVSDEEYNALFDAYSGIFDKLIIEVTEGCQISQKSIDILFERYKSKRAQIALDDYGTGYANESTLLSIKPDYVKIDHSLITGINSDNRKRHLVTNMISFAKSHGIKTLGEGVETREELETVITLGVDLIQGFYTCKPNAVIVLDIPEEIKNEILDINIRNIGYAKKEYVLDTSELTDIAKLSAQGYTDVIIKADPINLTGSASRQVNLRMICEDGYKGTINISNINISGVDAPALALGSDCEVMLNVEGENTFFYEGIRVPKTSRFILTGEGSLSIDASANNAVIIGGSAVQSFGEILIDLGGSLKILSKGDNIVAVGGGTGHAGISSISIVGGKLEFYLRSASVLGVGALSGEVSVKITKSDFRFDGEGQNVIAIGSKNGKIDVECNADFEIKCAGDNCCAIGTLEGGSGQISMQGGCCAITVNAKNAVAVGAVNGNTNVTVNSGSYNISCEGNTAVGIGDAYGSESITVINGVFNIHTAASNECPIGTRDGRTVIHSGNIRSDSTKKIRAVSPYGDPLEKRRIDTSGSFRREIVFGGSEYTYSAEPKDGEDFITAYLPEGYFSESDTE